MYVHKKYISIDSDFSTGVNHYIIVQFSQESCVLKSDLYRVRRSYGGFPRYWVSDQIGQRWTGISPLAQVDWLQVNQNDINNDTKLCNEDSTQWWDWTPEGYVAGSSTHSNGWGESGCSYLTSSSDDNRAVDPELKVIVMNFTVGLSHSSTDNPQNHIENDE